MRTSQDVMRELGGKLSSMKDQTLAVAFAQETLGKAGANLLPFLYELARAGDLQAKVTTDQAKAAKDFEDNLQRLRSASEQFRNQVANDLLPTLSALLEKLLAIQQAQGGGFIGFMAKLGIDAAQTADPIRAVDELNDKLAELKRRRDALDPNNPSNTRFDKFVLQANQFLSGATSPRSTTRSPPRREAASRCSTAWCRARCAAGGERPGLLLPVRRRRHPHRGREPARRREPTSSSSRTSRAGWPTPMR
jgi:hypothetical protein